MVCCGLLSVKELTPSSHHIHSRNDLSWAIDDSGKIVGLVEDFDQKLALATPCVESCSFFDVGRNENFQVQTVDYRIRLPINGHYKFIVCTQLC